MEKKEGKKESIPSFLFLIRFKKEWDKLELVTEEVEIKILAFHAVFVFDIS